MTENELSTIVVNAAFQIHTKLGPGLFESVYETALDYDLREEYGLFVKRQVEIPVIWKGQRMENGFRADLIVEEKLIVEIKSIDFLADIHFKQLHTYLRLTRCKLGLLINFNEVLIKNGIKRVVNNL